MAKITDYTALTTPSDNDVLVIEDLTAGSTKKITRGDLLTSGTRYTEQSAGWVAGSGTWTYASASTFTVPAADAALLSTGSKIRLVQTTTKYFYVASVSGTTVTIVVNTSYTLANAAITSPYLSNAATPFGFPKWMNYTSTQTNVTEGNGVKSASFAMEGKLVHFRFRFSYGSTSSSSGTQTGTIPLTASSFYTASDSIGTGFVDNAGVESYMGTVFLPNTTTFRLKIPNTSTDTRTRELNITLGNGDTVTAMGTYEPA